MNIAQIAADLNTSRNPSYLVDDNPAEREIVRSQLPGVAVPPMDGVENYITTIDRSGFFEVTTFSEDEDPKRNETYKNNVLRSAQIAAFGND